MPLLHFNGTPRAFEATWKYLLVGGTGIALSLLGSLCLGYASLHGGGEGDLTFVALMSQGAGLSRPWVLIAWVLLLVGYGTKMGLAPMHTWKPDAYGEAPGIVGAILAGGVTSVAFTAILRVRSVIGSAGAGVIADRTLLAIGLFSMLVAALFLLGTRDYKRMLAYSSVEHMGILTIGASLGPAGVAAALFHVWSNGLTKGALFLSAGNIRRAAGSPSMDDVRGMAMLTPRSATIFVTGMFAVTALSAFRPVLQRIEGGARRARNGSRCCNRHVPRLPAAGVLRTDPCGIRHCGWSTAHGNESGQQTLCGNGGRDPATTGAARLVFVARALCTGRAARCLVRCRLPTFSTSMSASTPFALLANATSLPWTDVPQWPVADFVRCHRCRDCARCAPVLPVWRARRRCRAFSRRACVRR